MGPEQRLCRIAGRGWKHPGMPGHKKLSLLQLSFPGKCGKSFEHAKEQSTRSMNGWSNEGRWYYEGRQRSDAAEITIQTG